MVHDSGKCILLHIRTTGFTISVKNYVYNFWTTLEFERADWLYRYACQTVWEFFDWTMETDGKDSKTSVYSWTKYIKKLPRSRTCVCACVWRGGVESREAKIRHHNLTPLKCDKRTYIVMAIVYDSDGNRATDVSVPIVKHRRAKRRTYRMTSAPCHRDGATRCWSSAVSRTVRGKCCAGGADHHPPHLSDQSRCPLLYAGSQDVNAAPQSGAAKLFPFRRRLQDVRHGPT